MQGEIKSNTVKGVKWTFIEKLFLQGIQFLIGIILARLLTPSDFGVVGILTVFIYISQTFIDGGFSNALIRKIDRTERDFSTAFYFNIAVGIVCYSLLFLLSPLVADFFNIPILCDLLKVLAISLFINSLQVVQIAKLTICINFRAQAFATLVSTTISGIIAIYMALNGFGVWALAWQTVFASFFKGIIIWYQTKWHPQATFSIDSFRNLFSYGSKLLISNLIGTIYTHIATIVIGRFYTPKDLGYYSRGQQFAHMPSITIIDSLGRVTFPILARLQNDDERLSTVYRKYIKMTSMAIFFLLLLMAAIAKPLILIVLTEKWSDATIFLQIFCLAYLTEHISKLNLNLLQIKGHSDLYLRLEIIKKILAFAILIASVPFGVVTICISQAIYGQVALFLNTYYTGKLFGLGYFKQFSDFLKYLIFSSIACMPAYLITFIELNSILQICLGILVATSLYILFLRKDSCFIECQNIAKDYILR